MITIIRHTATNSILIGKITKDKPTPTFLAVANSKPEAMIKALDLMRPNVEPLTPKQVERGVRAWKEPAEACGNLCSAHSNKVSHPSH